MIVIDSATCSMIMRALPESFHPEAKEAANRLRLSAIESLTRDAEFNNEAPALCRRQAG